MEGPRRRKPQSRRRCGRPGAPSALFPRRLQGVGLRGNPVDQRSSPWAILGVYVSSMTNHPEFAWDRGGSRDVGFSNLNLGPSGQTGGLAYPAPGVSVLSSHFTGRGAGSLQTAPASCPQIPELSFAGCLSHHGLGTSPHCLLVSFYHLFLPLPPHSLQATIQTRSLGIFLFLSLLAECLLCYPEPVFSIVLCGISEQ